MENTKVCPMCGCTEFGKGKSSPQGWIFPINGTIFAKPSPAVLEICTRCGYILSMRVTNPEGFKE